MPSPLQVIAVSFGSGVDFEGRVLAEVDRLQGRGLLRLLDVLFVAKDEDGAIQQLVVGDDEDFGELLASVVGLDGADLAESSAGDGLSGFDPADAWALAESLQPVTRWRSCSSSTVGRSRCSTRSPTPVACWWARAS